MNVDFIYQIVSYLAIFILLFVVIEFYTKGFIVKYIRVKASRGKKVLVRVIGQVTDYLEVGDLAEGTIKFKDRSVTGKGRKVLAVPDGAIKPLLGVNWVAVNEKLNAVLNPDFKGVTGYDAERINNLLLRALYSPPLTDPKQMVLIVLTGACLLGIIYLGIKTGSIEKSILALQTIPGANL